MAKKDKDEKKTDRANKELQRQTNPERAARLGRMGGTKDAYCTECTEWYDSTDQGQVNKHAH